MKRPFRSLMLLFALIGFSGCAKPEPSPQPPDMQWPTSGPTDLSRPTQDPPA